MKYNILATGSSGNAVIIEDRTLIDIGVSYKVLKPYVRDLQLVLLTHVHSDHFKKSTVRKLAAERPTLRFGCCEWMVEPLVECGVAKKNIVLLDFDTGFAWNDNAAEPFPLFHDVPNCGWKVFIDDMKAAYATDTSKILTEAKNYDLYLVEANWEDAEVQERIEKKIIDGAEYIHEYKAMRNHLSEKDAIDWIVANAGPKSEYVLLHAHKGKEETND